MPGFFNIPGETTDLSRRASAELLGALEGYARLLKAIELGNADDAIVERMHTLDRLESVLHLFDLLCMRANPEPARNTDQGAVRRARTNVAPWGLELSAKRIDLAYLSQSEVQRFWRVVSELRVSKSSLRTPRAIWKQHSTLTQALVRLLTIGEAVAAMSVPRQ